MKHFFTENLGLKLLSLVMAFGLWAMIRAGQQIERNFNVPVEMVGLPENLVVVGDVDPNISLRIRGTRTRLAGLEKKFSRPYTLNLSDAKIGTNTFSVVEEDLNIPYATRVSRISPQIIRVTVEKAESRVLRVEPNFVGNLDEAFKTKSVEIFPQYIEVTGPSSKVSNMKAISTEPIPLQGREDSFDGMYTIRVPDSSIQPEERQVALKVEIEEVQVSQVVEDVPVLLRNAPNGVEVSPSKISVELRGPASKVRSITKDEFAVSVDLSKDVPDLKPGTSVTAKLVLPDFPDVEATARPSQVKVMLPKSRKKK